MASAHSVHTRSLDDHLVQSEKARLDALRREIINTTQKMKHARHSLFELQQTEAENRAKLVRSVKSFFFWKTRFSVVFDLKGLMYISES